MTQLSENFSLEELTHSDTAIKKKIDNTPSQEIIDNLKRVCEELMQPIRDEYGKPIIVTSGYRSEALNKALNGSKTSQHRFGLAVDFKASEGTNKALWDLIIKLRDNGKLSFDQLIWEKGTKKEPSWIHIGLHETKNRNQILYLK